MRRVCEHWNVPLEPYCPENEGDILLVASFGSLVPASYRAKFKHCWNIHPSDLGSIRKNPHFPQK